MSYIFLVPARDELKEAVDFYNRRRSGLGDALADEVHHAIQRILQSPEAWPKLSPKTRRCRVNRFPYAVLYQVKPAGILIVAVMHLRRDPTYWRSRVSP